MHLTGSVHLIKINILTRKRRGKHNATNSDREGTYNGRKLPKELSNSLSSPMTGSLHFSAMYDC